MNKAYKVVRTEDGQRVSSDAPEGWQLTYTPERKTTPEIGEIFVFLTLDQARAYTPRKPRPEDGWGIWECECGDLTRRRYYVSPYALPADSVWEAWWKFVATRDGGEWAYLSLSMEGCYSTPYVIPRRQVWP